MTNSEAKEALKKRTPVIYNNIEYLYISAIIYRYDDNGNLVISAELADKCRHSVIIAQLKDVIPIYDNKNQTATFLS
jgi:hypothetical protein